MDYNKLIEYRAMIRDRMDKMLEIGNFELSIRYLTTIHETLFKGILFNNGHFRHYNITREEETLNLNTVDYPDYHTIPQYIKFNLRDQEKLDYSKMDIDEAIKNIAVFASKMWIIHPFSDGNTRTIGLFVEMYIKSLGYNVNHEIFKENAKYFRNALVRACYADEDNGIDRNYEPLIRFYKKVLIDSTIELNEDDLYVKELFTKNVKTKKRSFK